MRAVMTHGPTTTYLASNDVVKPTLSSLVASFEQGTRGASDDLFTTLYQELHRLARRELSRRGGGVSLGATTLLHEAYLDIAGRDGAAFPGPQPLHGLRLRA